MSNLWFYVLCFLQHSAVQGSTPELHSDNACHGIVTKSNTLDLYCNVGFKIVVKNIYAHSKPKSSNCPQLQTKNDVDMSCCTYDENDCSLPYNGSSIDSYHDCTGKSACSKRASWMESSSICNTSVYMDKTNYMTIDYYCIPDNTLDPCSDVTIFAPEIFIYKQRQSKFQCNCLLEPMCKMNYMINILMLSGGNQDEDICKQINIFTPNNPKALTESCNITKETLPSTLFNEFETMLSVKFINNNTDPRGLLLIQINGMSQTGEFKFTCGKPAFSRRRMTSGNTPSCKTLDTTTVETDKDKLMEVRNCNRTHALECKDPLCLPGWNLDRFFYICLDLDMTISEGFCAVYSEHAGIISFSEHSLCERFNASCPKKPYSVSEIKKYPTCMRVDTENKCYLDAPNCWKLRHDGSESEKTSTKEHKTNECNLQWPRNGWHCAVYIVFLLIIS
ncbi:uncharacterized protein LOC134269911 [Saccostrea cucullata]|uniref:uncharacterized protein LOC134269911 n=1 Tax=Saccostrea cuccullata TaxID=36930 RepID=UPI002ED22B60